AVFVSSLVVAQVVGMIFRVYGTSWPIATLGNLGGFAALIAVAYLVAWFKGQPWRATATRPPQLARDTGSNTQSTDGRGVPAASALPAGSLARPSQ
ncbi:MAG: OpgC domain-containing protein, partial [Pseudomonadota bacterium]